MLNIFARVAADAFVRPNESQTRPEARKHLGAVDFVRSLEEVLIRTCADFAIPSKRVPGLTGVWTDPQASSSRPETDSLLLLIGSLPPIGPLRSAD